MCTKVVEVIRRTEYRIYMEKLNNTNIGFWQKKIFTCNTHTGI